MNNKECVIKFLILKKTMYLNLRIRSRISNEYKQEVVDFLKCYSDIHFKEKGYINWEYYLTFDKDREEDIRGIIQNENKESDEVITDLQLMIYRGRLLFNYLKENYTPFNIKGVEYYLRLYSLNKDIDKNDEIKRAVLVLDITRLKFLLNSFSGSSSFLSNDSKDEQTVLFRNELTKIYLEMKAFLKTNKV